MSTQPIDPVHPPGAPGEPTRVGPYRLVEVLGEGGMGVVHLGLDPHGRAVAVKLLRDHVAHDAHARARLAREVATLRRVDHPGVAPFIGADTDSTRPYIVTRYVAGEPLDAWVAEHGPLRGDELVDVGVALREALEAIHRAGVVHRDLKPGNVLMPRGRPVVIDFGIAHVADDARLTSTGLVMGTPGYLSPELLGGWPVSEATDWWGYAATLAFAATGRAPFGGGAMPAVLDRVRRGEADLRGIAPALADVLRRALDPDPARRPSGRDIEAALAAPPVAVATATVPSVSAVAPATEALAHDARTGAAAPGPDGSAPGGRPQRSRPWRERSHSADAPRPTRPAAVAAATAAQPRIPTAAMPVQAIPAAPSPAPPYAGFIGAPAGAGPAWAGPGAATPPGRVAQPWPSESGVPPQATRPPSRRTGTLLALGAVVVALSATYPIVAAAAALGWSLLARFADRCLTSLALARAERGPRDRDVPLLVLASPWHLLGATVGAVVAAVLPALVVGSAAAGTTVLSGTGVDGILGDETALAVGALAGLVVSWWGPGGRSLRRGSRSFTRGVLPGRVGAVIGGALLCVVAVVLGLMGQANGAEPNWWPLASVDAASWGLPDVLPWG